MIGIDTNLLVRYLVRDDKKQCVVVDRFIDGLTQENPGFISHIVVVELTWVLESGYDFTRAQVVEVLQKLLLVSVFQIERPNIFASALRLFADGKADFADCLIAHTAVHAGCACTMTFDKKAAKLSGMTLLA